MKAWYKETLDSPLLCVERPDPELRPGSVIVDVKAVHVPAYLTAMVDSTEVPLPVPLVLGAGGVGTVRHVSADVYNLAVGDVVALDSLVESRDSDHPEDVMMGLGEVGGRGTETNAVSAMRDQWRDGTMAEQCVLPAQSVTRLPGAEGFGDFGRLAFLTWLGIAGEGILQSGQRPGDIVTILGATGQMGGAAVLVALARGASRVIAVGRDKDALKHLAMIDDRVATVPLTGDVPTDAKAMSAFGAPHVVIDAIGNAPDADAFLAGFAALRDEGTIVMMGGTRCDVPLPYGEVLRRRLTIKGSRMYRSETVLAIWRMIQSGLIDLRQVGLQKVGIDDPVAAIDAATKTTGLNFVALVP